ncbi:hypothetical protein AB3S75_000442 [Citrus x aurantiifolia]
MKLLGFCGILKETFKLIFSHKKLFTQITLAFIIPLSLIFQANIITSHLLISKIFEEKDSLEPTDFNIYKYSNLKFSNLKSFKWAAYWVLSQIAYYIPILILSLLCTSTVVYSVFCNYSAKDVTFRKTIAIVPKIWKQVLCTFLTVIYFVCKSYLNEDFAANSAMNAPQQKVTAVQEQLPV